MLAQSSIVVLTQFEVAQESFGLDGRTDHWVEIRPRWPTIVGRGMSSTSEADTEGFVDLYTRNGFAGPMATVLRPHYTPPYVSVQGTYAPHRLDMSGIPESLFERSQPLPVPLMEGDGVSVEVGFHRQPRSEAVRNVFADEIHYILEGSGQLDTDFGLLNICAGDFIVLPRAVTYRFAAITKPIREIVIVTSSQMTLDPQPAIALDVERNVDIPEAHSARRDTGPHKIVVRHAGGTTTYMFDEDPLTCLNTEGTPIVRRFSFENVPYLTFEETGLYPPKLFDDSSGQVFLFNLSNRKSPRPPIHHNADYDEIIFYVAGPGHYGLVDTPGTVVWVPKGIVHHGPAEDVPEGYKAFMVETRAPMLLTDAGRAVAALMETAMFGAHR
jgi:homogentisate 1,2-dioxygenase